MSGISNYILNQKINAILGKTSGLPSVIDLDTTLTTGNNAGANDIDMNNNDILQVNNIDLTTINGGAYPPTIPTPTNINITDDNTNAVFYPTFVSGTGAQPLLADTTTTPFSINPNTGDFNVGTTLKLTQTNVAVGKSAGATSQGLNSTAVGYLAGQTSQGTNAIAVGSGAGRTSQSTNSVAVGVNAGNSGQLGGAVAVGLQSGFTTQGANSVAIGINAGNNTQGGSAVAVGVNAGEKTQGAGAVAVGPNAGNETQGAFSVAVGQDAGLTNQGPGSVGIGPTAGSTLQGKGCVAVGNASGRTSQGNNAVAVGLQAGQTSQGLNAVAIGNLAGNSFQTAGSIALNGSGVALNPAVAGFFVNPIRADATAQLPLQYNSTTKEVTTGPPTFPTQTYSCNVLTNGNVKGTGTGKFIVMGNFVQVQSTITLTSIGDTNGRIGLSLPTTIPFVGASNVVTLGSFKFIRFGVAWYIGSAFSPVLGEIAGISYGTADYMGIQNPTLTLQVGDIVSMSISYFHL